MRRLLLALALLAPPWIAGCDCVPCNGQLLLLIQSEAPQEESGPLLFHMAWDSKELAYPCTMYVAEVPEGFESIACAAFPRYRHIKIEFEGKDAPSKVQLSMRAGVAAWSGPVEAHDVVEWNRDDGNFGSAFSSCEDCTKVNMVVTPEPLPCSALPDQLSAYNIEGTDSQELLPGEILDGRAGARACPLWYHRKAPASPLTVTVESGAVWVMKSGTTWIRVASSLTFPASDCRVENLVVVGEQAHRSTPFTLSN